MKSRAESQVTRQTRLDDMPELLTAPEFAAALGTGVGVVYAACASGSLPSLRIGRLLRIPKSALAAFTRGTESSR